MTIGPTSLVYKNPLLFDFVIFLDDVTGVIEYYGQQHFESVGFGSKDENAIMSMFNDIKKRDSR